MRRRIAIFRPRLLVLAAVTFAAATISSCSAETAAAQSSQQNCFEFPVVIVSAVTRSFPDPTCNQLRYPAPDCLKDKVGVRVEVVDHTNGSLNCFGATPTAVYDDVESSYRGQTSLFFPKHQMNVQFKQPTPFIGLPADKKFILNGPFMDCSLLRNHMAHWLFRGTGRYSPRTKHVAMFQRESPAETQPRPRYVGIFLLLEKLSYGPSRVNLAQLDTTCRNPSDFTGGWAWNNDPLSFGAYSPNVVVDQYQNEFGMGERPLIAYPDIGKGDTSQQLRDYFVNTTTGFLPQLYRALWNNMTDPDVLETHINLGSFADFLLHTEMSLNVDAYRRSTFFFKDRNQTINAGPVWDFNLAYGNGARRKFADWIFPQYTYWKRLMCHYKLTSLVIQRWKFLRAGAWSDEAITRFLNTSAAPIARQLTKCKTAPWTSDSIQCAFVSVDDCNGTYADQVAATQRAVLDRSHWMDKHITELYKPLNATLCSGVGTIPKYNCAANGSDDGCLTDPAAYYNAVPFPAIRTPYTGPSCAEQNKDSDTSSSDRPAYELPSDDECWKSSGLYVYPQQKGVRERNLTHFCNGYGSCPQGPGATCTCRKGIRLEPKTCRRIDAQSEKFMPPKLPKSAKSSAGEVHITGAKIFVVAIVLLALGGGLVVAYRVRARARRERMNVYQPVRYGSVDGAQASS